MKPLKTKVSITLDSTIIEQIRDLADKDDRSFSQYINLILKEYLLENNFLLVISMTKVYQIKIIMKPLKQKSLYQQL